MAETMMPTGNLVAGEYRGGSTDRVLEARNPATGEVLPGAFAMASEADVDDALRAACDAGPALRRQHPRERARFLRAIAEEIEALGDALVGRAVSETALPAARIQGERARTCGQLRLFADVVEEGSWVDARIDHGDPERKPLPKPDTRRMLMPLGPVVVFGASNFPLAFSTAGGDTASALAAGCPVVVKAHHAHCGTSAMVAEAVRAAAEKTGQPKGVFSHLHGPGRETGQALVAHPLTEAVGFTGSRQGGEALFQIAASRPRPIPVFAEMGSINPVFVLGGALAERRDQLAAGYCQSTTLGVGQFCTNPGVLAAPAGPPFDAFKQAAAALFDEVPEATMLTAGIASSYAQGLAGLLGSGAAKCVSKEPVGASGAQARAALVEAAAGDFLANATLREEVFGPASLLVACGGAGEMLAVARAMEGQLTATIHGTEQDLAENAELVDILSTKVGRLIFNGWPTGVEVCHSMNHGGPFPASTDPRFTSVGTAAILRFARPITYQGWTQEALPLALRDANELGISRIVDGKRASA